MRFFRRSLVGLMLISVTVGLLVLAGDLLYSSIQERLGGGQTAAPARERVFTANVTTASPASVAPVMTAFGEIRSRRTLELRSPRAGKVIELADGFEDGAAVTAGQLLLRLDPADAKAARDLALSDTKRAEAEVRDADRALSLARDDVAAAEAQAALRAQALSRQYDLRDRGVGSAAAVETAALAASSADQAVLSRRSALASAEARVDQAATALSRQKITLAEAERALRETELFAAFDGVLNGVSVVPGRILTSNEALGELIDPTALEVAFRISTAQFSRLIDGSGTLIPADLSASLDVSGTELLARGRLTRVGAAVGEGQSGRLIYANLTDAGGFRPGDFVTVRIEEPPLDAVITLPGTALGAANTVLVLGAEDRLEEMPVTLLRRQGDVVLIRAETVAGREVVTERSPLLGAGIKIKPVRAPAPGASAIPDAPAMVNLTQERREKLVAFVEANNRMPAEAKARILAQLAQPEVPAQVVERLESRMGG